jgi:hypothetical protein
MVFKAISQIVIPVYLLFSGQFFHKLARRLTECQNGDSLSGLIGRNSGIGPNSVDGLAANTHLFGSEVCSIYYG